MKGTGVAAGVFLGLAAVAPPSLKGSLLPVILPLPFFSCPPLFSSLQPSPVMLYLACPLPDRLSSCLLLAPLLFRCARSSLHSKWYRSSVAMVTRSSCCNRASSVGRSLLREASVSALSLQLVPPPTTAEPTPNPAIRLWVMPGASVRLQGLEEAERHEASELASTLSGVGGQSGLSNGGRHRDLQSLVEDEREGGSSNPSKWTLWRN